MKAIERAPKVFYGYQHVWDCVSHLDGSVRQRVWEGMQSALLGSSGRLHIARQLILMAVQKLGIAPAEEAVSRWHKLKPEDPAVIEAHADLLLNHGHGRTDFERALEMLEPAVKRFPYDSNLRFSQADALRKLGRFAEAEEVFHEIYGGIPIIHQRIFNWPGCRIVAARPRTLCAVLMTPFFAIHKTPRCLTRKLKS